MSKIANDTAAMPMAASPRRSLSLIPGPAVQYERGNPSECSAT
jgi:hypothetical protein